MYMILGMFNILFWDPCTWLTLFGGRISNFVLKITVLYLLWIHFIISEDRYPALINYGCSSMQPPLP